MEQKNEIMLDRAARIIRLDPNVAQFKNENKFLTLVLNEDGEEKKYDRVFLHRAFPHELLWEYISVLDVDNKEIGLIYNIEDFDADTVSILKTELERKYYSPIISIIESVKERYGFSYWNVITSDGKKMTFTMQDTYRNITHTGEDTLLLLDVDGNRFTVKSVAALDRKSYRKIEIYL